MADGMFADGAIVVVEDVGPNSNSDCVKTSASFYIDSDSGKLCSSKFVGKCRSSPCLAADHEDCRKKRCSDRYDSSESSDSGVAQLSCTDCSGCSSSSAASSDITDPGSPFSTGSSHGDDCSTPAPSPASMPPTVTGPTSLDAPSPTKRPWPWDNQQPSLKRSTKTAQSKTSPKRLKKISEVSAKSMSTPCIVSLVKSPLVPCHILPKPSDVAAAKTLAESIKGTVTATAKGGRMFAIESAQNNQRNQQGKITEYFKAQVKSTVNCVKKELTNLITKTQPNSLKTVNKRRVGKDSAIKPGDSQKYLEMLTGSVDSKVLLDGACDNTNDYFRKIDVRTLTVPNHLKKLQGDNNNKKNNRLNPVVSLTRKILPKPSPTMRLNNSSPQVAAGLKLSPLHVPNDSKLSTGHKPSECKVVANKINDGMKVVNTRTSSLIIPTNVNTAMPTIMTPKINSMQLITTPAFNCSPLVKLNGAFIPVVKLNSVPIKFNGSAAVPVAQNSINGTIPSVETALPTVPVVKPKCSVTVNECSLKSPKLSNCLKNDKTLQSKSSPEVNKITDLQKNKIETVENKRLNGSNLESITNHLKHTEVLQVSVTSSQTVESQKSPILSQPKTIRFPPKENCHDEQRRPDSRESGMCMWSDCDALFEASGALLEHLQVAHVVPQATKENYVCLWVGCKVHGRTSCSRSWLERHVLSHAGNKPYRCIVDGCGCRFNSQTALERHVNSHFNSTEGTPTNSARKSLESATSKLLKRNGKKIRYRLQPWSARMFDFFDAGIMEGLQQRLVDVTKSRTAGQIATAAGNTVTLRSRVLARRVESDKRVRVLLRWSPEDIVPDEWILESEVTETKEVPIPGLAPSAINQLHTALLKDTKGDAVNRRKHRRKTVTSAPDSTS